jgi:hypothetical protein
VDLGPGLLIAVGERANARDLSLEWAARWSLPLAVETPTFLGREEELERYLGLAPDLAVNLLAPSPVSGAWEGRDARLRASQLAVEAAGSGLLLLGRRVASAFGLGGAKFGSRADVGACRALVLPHPSGRNRLLNDPVAREWVGRFL